MDPVLRVQLGNWPGPGLGPGSALGISWKRNDAVDSDPAAAVVSSSYKCNSSREIMDGMLKLNQCINSETQQERRRHSCLRKGQQRSSGHCLSNTSINQEKTNKQNPKAVIELPTKTTLLCPFPSTFVPANLYVQVNLPPEPGLENGNLQLVCFDQLFPKQEIEHDKSAVGFPFRIF